MACAHNCSSQLECCPSWLAYLGAVLMWNVLIGVALWAIIEGQLMIHKREDFEENATEELCYITHYELQTCRCGSNCQSWYFEYFGTSSKCPKQILNSGVWGQGTCGKYDELPLEVPQIYTCYILYCEDNLFSFEKTIAIDPDMNPQMLVDGGIIMLTIAGGVPLIWITVYLIKKWVKSCKSYQRVPRRNTNHREHSISTSQSNIQN
eukprot:557185_1